MQKFTWILILLFFASCEQYFVPDIESQDGSLVFEGLVTNRLEKHYVKISKSLSYNQDSIFEKVSGFFVTIEDKAGNNYNLVEENPGYYFAQELFQGVVGSSYRMIAESPNGKKYLSNWEVLQPGAEVDSVHGEYAEKKILRYNEGMGYYEEDTRGIQLLSNTSVKTESAYYRYEYKVVYQNTQYYPTIPFGTTFFIARPATSLFIDFVSVANANLYANQQIVNHPVEFIEEEKMTRTLVIDSMEFDEDGNRIFEIDEIKYGQEGFLVQLNQYSISEGGYNFWDAIYKQSNASGQIFDPVESQIEGNVYCEQDEEELVFGYFGASAITTNTVYLKLKPRNTINIKPIIYFPDLKEIQTSRYPFDYWVR